LTKLFARVVFAMALLLGVGGAITPHGAAQGAPEDMLRYLDGIESAYGRRYISADVIALGLLPTPETTAPHAAHTVTVSVLEFEESGNAAFVFSTVLNDDIATGIVGGDGEFEVSTPTNVGDQAHLFVDIDEAHGDSAISALLAVQDGNLGFLITATGPDKAITETLEAFANFVIEAEPGDSDVALRAPANSTGGTFDVLPGVDDAEFLQNLVPMYDYDLLESDSPIEDAATPAA
jgi:hypothetical protein